MTRSQAAFHHRHRPVASKAARRQFIRRIGQAASGGDFRGAGDAVLDQHLGKAGYPFLVIAVLRIIRRRQPLAAMAGGIDVPFAKRPCRHGQRQRAGMPACGEHPGFIRFARHRTITEAPAHVMDAGHVAAPATAGNPVPIMESRVTNPASAASSMSPVPSGRIGSTR